MRTLPIQSQDRPVRNVFQEADDAQGSALVLPGAYYCSQAPGLYYTREVLYRAGCDVLTVDYGYFLAGEPFSEASRRDALGEAEAAYHYLSTNARAPRTIIAGKSLGSMLALDIALRYRRGVPTELVLLTPIENRLAAMLAVRREGDGSADLAEPWSVFAVRCGADDARDDAAWSNVRSAFMDVEEVSLDLTTHGLDALDGPVASLQGLETVCKRLASWLARQ